MGCIQMKENKLYIKNLRIVSIELHNFYIIFKAREPYLTLWPFTYFNVSN